ncbi:hypothetical protein CALVIDRAFT_193321 [Calocera viscosa TUFC12733]|uniref:GATA-type domain-containing protein n=1 Tax=Calocera viscosa (strain TUFC12733) TaxID=1330018 RepID=A0A167KQR7_CALVF|nr:hypothetical protein CALVIDRAFT_193321 [Calocera viscosa TUFC12733]
MAPRVNTKPKKAGMLKAVTEGECPASTMDRLLTHALALSNQFHSIQKTRTSGRLLAKKTHAVVASNDDVDMDHLAVAGSAPSKRGRAASVAIKKTLTAAATKLKSAGRRKEKMGDMMIIDPPQPPSQLVSISPNSSRTLVSTINTTNGDKSDRSSTMPSLTPSPAPSAIASYATSPVVVEVEVLPSSPSPSNPYELTILWPLTLAPPTSSEEDEKMQDAQEDKSNEEMRDAQQEKSNEEMQDAQEEGFNSITAWRFALTAPPPKFSPLVTPRAPTFSSPLTTPPSTAPPTPPPARQSLKIRVKNPTYVLPTAIRSRASLRVPSTISVESSRRDQKRGREENSEDDTEGLPKKRLKTSHESTTQPANLSDTSEPTPPLATDDDDCSVPQVTTSPDVTNAVTGPLSTPGKKSAKATKREIKALPKRQGTGSKKRGPCIVCGLDGSTKWKRQEGTKKDICHGCFERALNRDRVKETTAQEDDTASRNMLPVATGPASTVSAPSNTVEAPLSQSTRAAMDGKVVETMAPRDASTGQAKRAAAAQPPPILSAPLEADDFGNQPTKSTMTSIPFSLGKRKTKAPARYGGAIEDESILARLGEEDDIAEYERQAKKPKTRDTSLKFTVNFEKQTVERKTLKTEEQRPASKASNPRSPREKTKPTGM